MIDQFRGPGGATAQLRRHRPDRHQGRRRVLQSGLGYRQAHARRDQDEDHAQGHCHRRGCRSRRAERHRRHSGLIHGGRGEDNGRSTIDALPEIIAAVKGRMPVIVDSGFRRGTDVVKALAMGAQAVGVGRPYSGGSVPSARKAWSACLNLCGSKPGPRCSSAARSR